MSNKKTEMSNISDLITNMTVRGATLPELKRVIDYSMDVIDSRKRNIDLSISEVKHGISELRNKYLGV